ncbi:uncharacterized protein [Montipora foliosa]|uniref:uncharacterized protein n=1 Tax=Montipora foliosa TaxID=591990 RepID=UPI0035F17DDF
MSAAEEAKIIRRSAKGRFTRKRNELLKSIADKRNREIIESNYSQLVEAWGLLESKHDLYAMYLTDEEVENADNWITEVQESFTEAMTMKMSYINDIVAIESRERAEAEHEELQLEEAFKECKQTNKELLNLLTKESAESEIRWIHDIQRKYNGIIEKLDVQIAKDEQLKESKQAIKEKTTNLSLEKIKLPKFDGEIREYPQFKRDFQRHVEPTLDKGDVSYVLRSCLGKEPYETVKSVDDEINEMWKRLDDKYGDPAKVADVIIDSIRRTKIIREGEDKRLVEFVNMLEDGYRDLRRLGLEAEITTTSSVSIIERKLPMDIRREWAQSVSSDASMVDKMNKFPSLLRFLLNQKRAIEYDCAALRAYNSNTAMSKAVAHHATAREYTDERQSNNSKCLFHNNAEHWTSECKLYLSESVDGRKRMLKEKGACWSCLKRGHRIHDCKRKGNCGINDCAGKHHRTIHEERKEVTASANICSNSQIGTCLLQLQRIKTKRGYVNVMWDNAASISLITNKRAREEKLKGIRVELSIVKVGAKSEKIAPEKYRLCLIDKKGQIVEFDVYGIDKITSDIQSINIDGIVQLFKNVSKEEIVRPTGAIDVLIGYEYAGFHPEREQNSEHLLLLKNRFGRCIGGTHPLIKETSVKPNLSDVKVLHVMKANVEDFYNIENLGIECKPRCGGCKCGRCPIGSKEYSIKEERELELIDKNLEYDYQDGRWIAEYPWIKNPSALPDNRRVAVATLISTEKRLLKNPQHAKIYDMQIKDMVARDVARKLSKEELNSYKGPIHYISHHEVLKPDSKSTPVKIVFNSSAKYMAMYLMNIGQKVQIYSTI